MGNRQWPDEPEVRRRDDTTGWKVVGRAHGAAPAPRVWQGQVPIAQPPRPEQPPPYPTQWSAQRPPGQGYGPATAAGGVHATSSPQPGYYQSPYEPPHHPAAPYPGAGHPQYDHPTSQFPAQSYPDRSPPYPPAAAAGAEPSRARGRAARAGDHPRRESGAAWPAVMAWTVGFFVVPMLLFLVWAWTRSGAVPASCLDLGGPCVSPRTEALSTFVDALPGIAGAVTLSLLAAVGLRQLSEIWRPMTVGLGGAVIGAGIATLVASSF